MSENYDPAADASYENDHILDKAQGDTEYYTYLKAAEVARRMAEVSAQNPNASPDERTEELARLEEAKRALQDFEVAHGYATKPEDES